MSIQSVHFLDRHARNKLLNKYRAARKRLFLLDYDGTLTPFFNLPSLARPDNLLLDILQNISSSQSNAVYILSGRDSATLEKWLGHLPLGIITEQDKGAAIRKVLAQEDADFILAIGDDPTDEDMFSMLADNEQAATIKVGTVASSAQFNMHTPQMVLSLLGDMNSLEQQQQQR